jgi:hypothetical protein
MAASTEKMISLDITVDNISLTRETEERIITMYPTVGDLTLVPIAIGGEQAQLRGTPDSYTLHWRTASRPSDYQASMPSTQVLDGLRGLRGCYHEASQSFVF